MPASTLPSSFSMYQSRKIKKYPLVLILLGPPGAGKGTQADMLSKVLDLPHISTGDLLRFNIKEQTPIGNKAKSSVDQGHLVSDSLILEMVFDRVFGQDCQKGYILDGFPRTLAQAYAYDSRFQKGFKVVVFNLSLSDEEVVRRLSRRVICRECNAPYHLIYSPPKREGVCDACEGALIQRSDDREEVIRERLSVYQEQTAPLIAYYFEKKILKEVVCNGSIDEIFNQILNQLLLD